MLTVCSTPSGRGQPFIRLIGPSSKWTIRSTLHILTLDCQVQNRVSLVMVKAHAPATAKGRAMRERIVQAAAELVA